MIIEDLIVGPIMSNCFIVGCETTKEAVVIDPGDESNKILMVVAKHKLKVKYIINTHGHIDHVGGNKKLKEITGADLLIHSLDAPMLSCLSATGAAWGMNVEDSPPPDRMLKDGDEVKFGDITLKVIHTPGHSPGGISLYTDGCVFVGDTLFAGSIGRTDFPGGDYDTIISSIRNKLFVLGDNVRVLTGHGPETSIAIEKKFNPFAKII
ncbi:MAG: MBL fold metallo-hydrolase [Desulfobacterium sp.]|nr:MBL fold metallo-hydrolase [Desulfobacterium sp.]MBU3947763.1 MBL fold metallo-hydrolase [Pseudomonadota bacterium]MBU4036773.1 MBL fold metallo-hydrolase [Pseudomonadota bacterium]